MTISIECPWCQAKLKVKDSLAGREGICPKCKARVQIPMQADASAPPETLNPTTWTPTSSPPAPALAVSTAGILRPFYRRAWFLTGAVGVGIVAAAISAAVLAIHYQREAVAAREAAKNRNAQLEGKAEAALAQAIAQIKLRDEELTKAKAEIIRLQKEIELTDRIEAAAEAEILDEEEAKRRQLEDAYALLTLPERIMVDRITALERGGELPTGSREFILNGPGRPFFLRAYAEACKKGFSMSAGDDPGIWERTLDFLGIQNELRLEFYLQPAHEAAHIMRMCQEMQNGLERFLQNDNQLKFARENPFLRGKLLELMKEKKLFRSAPRRD